MEVPCCGGLEMAAKKALQNSGKFIPWQVVTVSIGGKILDWDFVEGMKKTSKPEVVVCEKQNTQSFKGGACQWIGSSVKSISVSSSLEVKIPTQCPFMLLFSISNSVLFGISIRHRSSRRRSVHIYWVQNLFIIVYQNILLQKVQENCGLQCKIDKKWLVFVWWL